MAVNKVIYGSNTLIDISDTTATADKILSGYTAYGADGNKITGSASGGAAIIQDTQDTAGGTIRSITTKSEVYLQKKTITPTSSSQTVTPDTGYDGFSSVTVNPPNLTTKTGSASEYTEVVTPYTVLRTVSYTSAVSQRTPNSANTYSSFGVDFYPEQVLTLNGEYRMVGVVEIINSLNQVIESNNVDETIVWRNYSPNMLLDEDSSAYITLGVISNGAAATALECLFQVRHLEAGNYGYKFKLYICETSSYVGLNSAIIETAKYSDEFMKDFIGRAANLKPFVFPDGIKSIGNYAFAGCTSLKLDSLPNTITSIGSYAFYSCTNITLTSLPSGLTSISSYAFQSCSKLALTSLPSGLTSISSYAFQSCSKLALTSLPTGVTNIGSYAFYGCTNLALTSLPSGLLYINSNAFYGCTNLALTSLPNSITKIYGYAFQNCSNLALTSLPTGIDTIESYCFTNCYNLPITTIPTNVTKINTCAFQCCESITAISGDGVITTLGGQAFNGSSSHPMSLVSARFPNMALTSNLGSVFGSTTADNACQLLELVDLGKSTGINSNSFANCYSLQTLILRKTTVASLVSTNAFTNTPMSGYNNLTGTVYVPSALIASYKTATNWSTLYTNGTIDFEAIEGSDYELS